MNFLEIGILNIIQTHVIKLKFTCLGVNINYYYGMFWHATHAQLVIVIYIHKHCIAIARKKFQVFLLYIFVCRVIK